MSFQKVGGIAAITEALCYITGFILFIFFLDLPSFGDSVEGVVYLIDNKALILTTMTLIYIFAGLVLLVLALALHEKLKDSAPSMMTVATAVGIIWVGVVIASGMIFNVGAESVIKLYAVDPEQAATLWMAVGVVQNGLGGGTELLGGVWIFLISLSALRGGKLSKSLNWLGLMIGVAGILSVVPAWDVFIEIFGLSQIIWFLWIGMALLLTKETS